MNIDKCSYTQSRIYKNGKPCILIIDDSTTMRKYLQNILQDDYDCLFAVNGEMGIRLAIERTPDMILSDVLMPDIDGLKVLQTLRADIRTCYIPILMLTGHKDRETRLKSWKMLADDFIMKPFDKEELKARLYAKFKLFYLQVLYHKDYRATKTDNICPHDKTFLENFEKVINECYVNSDITIEEISEKLYLSVKTVQNRMRDILNKTPMQYLREYRLNKAKELILYEDINIGLLSEKVGFASHQNFSKSFKCIFGLSPMKYRKKNFKNN